MDYVSIEFNGDDDTTHRTTSSISHQFDDELLLLIYRQISLIDKILDCQISRYYYELKIVVTSLVETDYLNECVDISHSKQCYHQPCYYEFSNSVCHPIKPHLNTFLVNNRLDIIFSYMIDMILIENHYSLSHSIEERNHMRESAYSRLLRRLHIQPICPYNHINPYVEDDGRLCPRCWVIYTRTDSSFYTERKEKIMSCETVDFVGSVYDYIGTEHLSFTLVQFLCSNNITPIDHDHTYEKTNQWIKLPTWFLLV